MRLSRFGKCLAYGIEACADDMARFWRERDDSELRHGRLKAAMLRRDLEIRKDSSFCDSYINGAVDVDAEEVAAVMCITSELWDAGGSRAYRQHSGEAESVLTTAVFDHGKSWDQGLNEALRVLRRIR